MGDEGDGAGELYDRIGVRYATTRQADPRIERVIHDALGDARTVLNVGAGAGSYEPRDRDVVAVEPSAVMRAQRDRGAPRAIQASAEALPFGDGAFDAAMAVLSDHHWADRPAGLREMRRVARSRAVLFTWDSDFVDRFWLVRDYLPGIRHLPWMGLAAIAGHLGAQTVLPVPVPADCRDGFFPAFWARPDAYLDPRVRAGISVLEQLDEDDVRAAFDRLRTDLESGAWHARNADLLGRDTFDFGYRLLVAEYEHPARS